jgi:hypothetical protein
MGERGGDRAGCADRPFVPARSTLFVAAPARAGVVGRDPGLPNPMRSRP